MAVLPPDTGSLDPGSEGITINAGTSGTPPEDRKVRWLKESDGSLVAQIYGFTSGGGNTLTVDAVAPTNVLASAEFVAANDPGGAAGIRASFDQDRGPKGEVWAITEAVERLLLNSIGQSDFLQLAGTGGAKLAIGVANCVAASASGAEATVNHGITDITGAGRKPVIALATVMESSAFYGYTRGFTTTQIVVGAQQRDGVVAAINVNVAWLAI